MKLNHGRHFFHVDLELVSGLEIQLILEASSWKVLSYAEHYELTDSSPYHIIRKKVWLLDCRTYSITLATWAYLHSVCLLTHARQCGLPLSHCANDQHASGI